MKRRVLILALVLSSALGACGGDFGVGLPGCEEVIRRPSSATILVAQAVPTAKYGPCIEEIKLGWDDVGFSARNGLAELDFLRADSRFLVVRLQEECAVDPATEVASDVPGVAKFEEVESVGSSIGITLIPSSERALIYARTIVDDNRNTEINGRLVVFDIDDEIDQSLRARTNRAMFGDRFAMILTEVDVEEHTVDLRLDAQSQGLRLSLDDALEEVQAVVLDVMYRGRWSFTFDGGCITYDFDASGRVADGLAADAQSAIGFYDLEALRDLARREGLLIEAPPGE